MSKPNRTPNNIFYKQLFEQYGNKFCSAPWTSVFISPSGDMAPCCKYSHKAGRIVEGVDDYYNSEHIRQLRLDFMAGTPNSNCQDCWTREAKGITRHQMRQYHLQLGQDQIHTALAATGADGAVERPTAPIAFWDVCWSNRCNFGCVMCSGNNSTTLLLPAHAPGQQHIWGSEILGPANDLSSLSCEELLSRPYPIKRIHLSGGEPFMQPAILKLLRGLRDQGRDSDIELHCHTNGSIINGYDGEDLVDELLTPWRGHVSMTVSVDHVGSRGRWIRWGYKDSVWQRTWNRLLTAGVQLKPQTTLGVLNVLTIDRAVEVWRDLYPSAGAGCQNSYGVIQYPQSLALAQICAVPELAAAAVQSLQRAADIIRPVSTADAVELQNRAQLIPTLRANTGLLPNFYRAVTALDQGRGSNFLETFPELEPLYALSKRAAQAS